MTTGTQQAPPPRRLDAALTAPAIDTSAWTFDTTADLDPLDAVIGQNRALEAIELGLGVHDSGYNIFVCGLTGSGKMTTVQALLQRWANRSPTPPDHVYVHNFADPEQPRPIALAAGQGRALADEMRGLVQTLRLRIPQALKSHEFEEARMRTGRAQEAKLAALFGELERKSSEHGFLVRQVPPGRIVFVPAIAGKVIESEEDLRALDKQTLAGIEQQREQLLLEVPAIFERQRALEGEFMAAVRQLEQEFCRAEVAPLIAQIKARHAGEEIATYLDAVEHHVMDHIDRFREVEEPRIPMPLAFFADDTSGRFVEYQVNVVVDNSATRGAPIVVESAPSYPHLFGTIERIADRFGRLVTNFSMIRGGAILRAHGGFLVFNLDDAISEPLVWKSLKRFLRTGEMATETYEPLPFFSAAGIKPLPIAVRTKLVVVGSPLLYELLVTYDEDFRKLFKIRADFAPDMARDAGQDVAYARFVAKVTKEEQLPAFSRDGVAEVVRFGLRRADHQRRLTARLGEIADLVREASYWAARDGATLVSGEHVAHALERRVYRSNRVEERLRELVSEGVLRIDTSGSVVGQVNGLAVLAAGEHVFGRPSRVTAAVGLGQAGIINIEREAKMSGRTHDKGVLILAGYLRHRFAQRVPLTLSASLCFEQSYGEVDGDSASSTELYALLSALAGIPLRQDIGVTGSVDQWGNVQAIGGVNEKIEGFHAACVSAGLSGTQGVIIPEPNVGHLGLRRDVRDAIAAGQFHIYPVRTIDQGIEILTGIKAGAVDEEGTVNAAVATRLREFSEMMQAHRRKRDTDEAAS